MEDPSDELVTDRLRNWGEDEYESVDLLSFPQEFEEDDFLRWLDRCETCNLSSFLQDFKHNKMASWLLLADHLSSHPHPQTGEGEGCKGAGGETWTSWGIEEGPQEADEEHQDGHDADHDRYYHYYHDSLNDCDADDNDHDHDGQVDDDAESQKEEGEKGQETDAEEEIDEEGEEGEEGRESSGASSEGHHDSTNTTGSTRRQADKNHEMQHCSSTVGDKGVESVLESGVRWPRHTGKKGEKDEKGEEKKQDKETERDMGADEAASTSETALLPPIPEDAVLETPTPKTSTGKVHIDKSPPSNVVDSTNFSSGLKQYFVSGEVNNASVEAFPDSGADRCYISSQLATNLGVNLVPGTERDVKLANKKSVESPGMVEVPFKFEGEQHEHTLSCWIIPNCIHDLILGRDFLGATKTLTQYARRIGSKMVSWPGKLRLSYLDGERQRLWGWFGDFFVDALPDTGSDLMLMSGEFARRIGLRVDQSFENWLEVEFADATSAWTSGVVRNVPWTVGETTIYCDFHVLEDLRVDVILSKDYLFGMNAFSEYGKFFSDTTAEVDLYKLYNAGSVGKYNGTPSIFNGEHQDQGASQAADDTSDASSIVDLSNGMGGFDFADDEILAFPKSLRQPTFGKDHYREFSWSMSIPSTLSSSASSASSVSSSTSPRRSRSYDVRSGWPYSSHSPNSYKDVLSTKRGAGTARLTSRNLQKMAKRWEEELDLRGYL